MVVSILWDQLIFQLRGDSSIRSGNQSTFRNGPRGWWTFTISLFSGRVFTDFGGESGSPSPGGWEGNEVGGSGGPGKTFGTWTEGTKWFGGTYHRDGESLDLLLFGRRE